MSKLIGVDIGASHPPEYQLLRLLLECHRNIDDRSWVSDLRAAGGVGRGPAVLDEVAVGMRLAQAAKSNIEPVSCLPGHSKASTRARQTDQQGPQSRRFDAAGNAVMNRMRVMAEVPAS